MMGVPILPPEVLRMIFEDTSSYDKDTLCDLMLVSRHFRDIAEPVMYAEVALQDDQAVATEWLKCLLQIFETSGGRTALFVKSLIIHFSVSGQTQLQLVGKILMRTKNLKILNFPCPGAPPPFPQHPTFALETLVIYDSVLDQDSIHFLESQSSLETLHLRRSDPLDMDMSMSPTALPKLRHLVIGNNDLSLFLPSFVGVTHLGLEWGYRVASPQVRDPPSSLLHCVRVLSFREVFPSPKLILLTSSCANLEWLDIHDEPSSVLPFLRYLCEPSMRMERKLRGIRFETPWRLPRVPQSPFQRLFDAIPSLQFVEFFQLRIRLGRRWYRGSPISTKTQWMCPKGHEWLADWEKDVDLVEDTDADADATPEVDAGQPLDWL